MNLDLPKSGTSDDAMMQLLELRMENALLKSLAETVLKLIQASTDENLKQQITALIYSMKKVKP